MLLGQADTVHDFWGQVYRPGSPIRNKGFKGRPLFPFAGAARLCHQDQHISAELIYAFLKGILLNVAQTVGHKTNVYFIQHPLQPARKELWRDLQVAAASAEEDSPSAAQLAAAKWGYTCGTHVIANHLFKCSFSTLPRSPQAYQELLDGSAQAIASTTTTLPDEWLRINDETFLGATRFLSHTMSSLHAIFAEMNLPVAQRAGTKAVAESGPPQTSTEIDQKEIVLGKALRRCKGKEYMVFKDIKPHMNSKLRTKEHYMSVFQLAQGLGVGVIEEASGLCRLKLTLRDLQAEARRRLGLEADMGDLVQAAPSHPLPRILGGAKNPRPKQARKPRPKQAPVPQAPALQAAAKPKTRGRPSKTDKPPRSLYTPDTVVEGGYDGKASFLRAQKDWASKLVEGKVLSIRHQWYPFKPGWKVLLWCNSCEKCSQHCQGWSAWCIYSAESQTFCRKYTTVSAHGDFSKTRTWNALTSTTEARLKEHMQSHSRVTTQDLLKIAEETQAEKPVAEAFLSMWRRNHKECKDGSRPSGLWRVYDWQQLLRGAPQFDTVAATVPNNLAVVSADLSPAHTTVVFVNPALFHETFSRLTNQQYIKLCGDGTFRLMQGGWVLLNLGVLTKHYAAVAGTYAFRSTYSPLLFAVANKECRESYRALFEGAVVCAKSLFDIDLAPRVSQYGTLEKIWPVLMFSQTQRGLRIFAHFIGACVRPKQALSPDETVQAYRAGFSHTIQKHLQDQAWAPVLVSRVHLLRSVPSALLFHTITQELFAPV